MKDITANSTYNINPELKGIKTLSKSLDERISQLTPFKSVGEFSNFLEDTSKQGDILEGQILLDTGCNQNCIHCFLGKKNPIQNLNGVSELFINLINNGIKPSLYFSEPFNSSGNSISSEEIIKFLSKHHSNFLLSNGIEITQKTCELLRFHGPFCVYLSLLGITPETHEKLTQSTGSFKKAIESIKYLGKMTNSIKLCLNIVVYRGNLAEFEDMLQFAFENNVKSVYIIQLFPGPESPDSIKNLCLTYNDLVELVRKIGKIRHKYYMKMYIELGVSLGPNFHMSGIYNHLLRGKFYCPAGRSRFVIHPSTNKIFPCAISSGYPNHEIGFWDPIKKEVVVDDKKNVLANLNTDVNLLKGMCSPDNCQYAPICRGGCRFHAAVWADGDLLAGQRFCITRILDEIE